MWTELVLKVLQCWQRSHPYRRPIGGRHLTGQPRHWTGDFSGGPLRLWGEKQHPRIRRVIDGPRVSTPRLDNDATQIRVTRGSQEYVSMLREVTIDVMVGDACRRFEGVREKEGVSGASSLTQAAIASDARGLYSNGSAIICARRDGITRFSPLWNEKLHRGQSRDTGEPSRESV